MNYNEKHPFLREPPEFHEWWNKLDDALGELGYHQNVDFAVAKSEYRLGNSPAEAADRITRGVSG